MSSSAAVPFWRVAGMTYVTYSNICANLVRNSLKEPHRSEALAREKVHYSVSKWVEGKPEKTKGADIPYPRRSCKNCLDAYHKRRADAEEKHWDTMSRVNAAKNYHIESGQRRRIRPGEDDSNLILTKGVRYYGMMQSMIPGVMERILVILWEMRIRQSDHIWSTPDKPASFFLHLFLRPRWDLGAEPSALWSCSHLLGAKVDDDLCVASSIVDQVG
ncbi:hypothetical protein Droror1_Dr00007642 [Drosera rotundifolia]